MKYNNFLYYYISTNFSLYFIYIIKEIHSARVKVSFNIVANNNKRNFLAF